MIDAFVANPMARALGLALLHFLWQGVVIGAVVAFALRRLRDSASATRYAVACAGLLAMIAAPAVTVTWLLAGTTASAAAAGPSAAVLGPATSVTVGAGVSTLDRALPLVVLAWAAGVFALALHLASGWLDVRRLRQSGRRLDRGWQDRAAALAGALGLTRTVTVVESSLVDGPMVLGWIRPAILLPTSALAGLTPSQLDAILTHELAHVRRQDYLVNVLQNVVETLLFYHPAVWWVSQQVRLEREHCCDDEVVAACGDRVGYARALASLEQQRAAALAFGMAATGGQLLGRIRRVLGVPGADEPRTPGWSAFTVMVVIVPLLLVAVVETAPDPVSPPGGRSAATAAFEAALSAGQGTVPIRVGGAVRPPEKIRDVKPLYPKIAQAANVTGVVIIEAVIAADGTVQNARVLRGNPMLDQAALDAVLQWRYTPPLLDGQPVSVIMTVTVNFTLNGGRSTVGGSAGGTDGRINALGGSPGGIATPQDLSARMSPFPDDITRVGGGIPAPRKIFDAKPVYPEDAKAAGVQGVVILEVLLDEGGFVADVYVLRAHEMLEQAAIDAVRQWRYEPILVDGQAVPMVMTVTVNFVLDEDTFRGD